MLHQLSHAYLTMQVEERGSVPSALQPKEVRLFLQSETAQNSVPAVESETPLAHAGQGQDALQADAVHEVSG